jgi:hypothetical protein
VVRFKYVGPTDREDCGSSGASAHDHPGGETAALREMLGCDGNRRHEGEARPQPYADSLANEPLAKGPSSTMLLSEEYLVEKPNTSARDAQHKRTRPNPTNSTSPRRNPEQ